MIRDRVDHFKAILADKTVKVDEEDRDMIVHEAARRDPRIVNLLDMVIRKRKRLKNKGDFLIVPIYETEKGEKMASILHLRTTRRIKLDSHGWFIWNSIDGKRDVRELGKMLQNEFGDDVAPLYPRLSRFLAYLDSLKIITIGKRN